MFSLAKGVLCLIAGFRSAVIRPSVIPRLVRSRDSDLRLLHLRSSRALFDRGIRTCGDATVGHPALWLIAGFRPTVIPPSVIPLYGNAVLVCPVVVNGGIDNW